MEKRKILLAYDFSAKADVGLREALVLAEKMEFDFLILHVIRDAWREIPREERAKLKSLSAGELMQKADDLSREKLDKILASAKGIPEERKGYMIRVGDPSDRILETIEENHIDIVILGSLGRSAFGNQLLGSVAEKVVHRADCSVLISKTIKNL